MDLEILFTDTHDKNEVREMTVEECKTLIQFSHFISEEAEEPFMTPQELDKFCNDNDAPFGTKVLARRLILIKDELKFSMPLVLVCSRLCETPAHCVMWAYTLVKKTREVGRPLGIKDFGEFMPWGVPTKHRYNRLWDEQKVDSKDPGFSSENYLDTYQAYNE